ncbi:nucleotidyltransferase family protein [Winogradskyella sp.]|nr:nucleotidyltransferase family protein [Winogradskyella sp.]
MALTPHKTLQCITNILTFSPNATALETQLRQFTDEDWLDLVKVGSSHLVLTTIYCRLQQKQLLQVLPKDLEIYLHDLTAINRNRNTTILKQIEDLSQLLKNNNINHVFLKGAALLVSGYYKDLGERMICDIDILIDNTQLKLAAQLIRAKGYESEPITFGTKYKNVHNDPILIPKKTGIAAIELHRHVLHKHSNNYLSTHDLLLHKRIYNTFYIPSKQQLLSHIILNFEINDYGYNQISLGLRNAYDFIIVANKLTDSALKSQWNTSKYHRMFIAKVGFYFKEIDLYNFSYNDRLRYFIFKKSQEETFFKKIYFFSVKHISKAKIVIQFYKDLIHRTILFITNKNYRQEAWQDRKRLIGLLKAKFLR